MIKRIRVEFLVSYDDPSKSVEKLVEERLGSGLKIVESYTLKSVKAGEMRHILETKDVL